MYNQKFSMKLCCVIVVLSLSSGYSMEITMNERNMKLKKNAAQVQQPQYEFVEVIPVAHTPIQPEPSWKVSAALSNGETAVMGMITFTQLQPDLPTIVNINSTGLSPGSHSVHVHSFGDITEGCKSTGPHFLSGFVNFNRFLASPRTK